MSALRVELSALGFQALVTILLALVCYRLWRHTHRPYFASWAGAWGLYAIRLGAISVYLARRHDGWLFVHQAVTGLTALLLLWAAFQFSLGLKWRPRYAWLAVFPVAWGWFVVLGIHNFVAGGIVSVTLLSAVTLWTAVVFFRHWRHSRSAGAAALSATFLLWGLHHLDYPLLRFLGAAVLYGVFADVLFIVATAVSTMFMVLSEGRQALEARTAQLEQLTRLLLRAQEDERRRIARDLHDEAGQILTAVKIELDLEGRKEASEMVGRALGQVRDVSNLLRPTVLDDLGLIPALRGLCEDFARRTRIDAALEADDPGRPFSPDVEVVIYRVVQEALTNVARHAEARRARVHLEVGPGSAGCPGLVRLVVEDDGRGVSGEITPHLGLLGMRERVTALGGSLALGGGPGAGFRLEAVIPVGEAP